MKGRKSARVIVKGGGSGSSSTEQKTVPITRLPSVLLSLVYVALAFRDAMRLRCVSTELARIFRLSSSCLPILTLPDLQHELDNRDRDCMYHTLANFTQTHTLVFAQWPHSVLEIDVRLPMIRSVIIHAPWNTDDAPLIGACTHIERLVAEIPLSLHATRSIQFALLAPLRELPRSTIDTSMNVGCSLVELKVSRLSGDCVDYLPRSLRVLCVASMEVPRARIWSDAWWHGLLGEREFTMLHIYPFEQDDLTPLDVDMDAFLTLGDPTSLRSLALGRVSIDGLTDAFTDNEPHRFFTALESLRITTEEPFDYNWIFLLPRLCSLEIYECSSLKPHFKEFFAGLPKRVTTLGLAFCCVSATELALLPAHLTSLDLSFNPITSFSHLTKLGRLETLQSLHTFSGAIDCSLTSIRTLHLSWSLTNQMAHPLTFLPHVPNLNVLEVDSYTWTRAHLEPLSKLTKSMNIRLRGILAAPGDQIWIANLAHPNVTFV
jgi:hypothetical protein